MRNRIFILVDIGNGFPLTHSLLKLVSEGKTEKKYHIWFNFHTNIGATA